MDIHSEKEKEPLTLSPLMRTPLKRKNAVARLVGAISKSRAKEWLRYIKKTRQEWS